MPFPTALVRLAKGLVSAWRRQQATEHETYIRARFAALDRGTPVTSIELACPKLFPRGPMPNPYDPLEALWQLQPEA